VIGIVALALCAACQLTLLGLAIGIPIAALRGR
jgi:hypothetical protein